jgi:hypothetical protein
MVAELFHEGRRTDRQTDEANVAFPIFAHTIKNQLKQPVFPSQDSE